MTSMEEVKALQLLDFRWKLRLSLLPRKCELSGNWIPMFTRAYKGVRTTSIPEENWKFYAWATKEQYIFEKIKGNIK